MIQRARLLLCTDLDRTLIPNGPQPESMHARRRFGAFVEHPDVTLVYVTGRDRARVERAMANYQLPRPAFVITDAGTNIYDLRDRDWQIWPQWVSVIARDWNGHKRSQLATLLAGVSALRPQEYNKQNTYKLSYYVPLYTDVKPLERVLLEIFDAAGIAASLVWSIDEPAAIGLLDILPRRATKLHAIEYLGKALDFPSGQMLFAGDSGNDLAVLASAIPSVLVANAMPLVLTQAAAAADANGTRRSLFLAEGGLLGMNGNYSAGILEGIRYYFPDMIELYMHRWGKEQDGQDASNG